MDWTRVARMTGFGLVFYGPFQHVWYRALDFRFPRKTTADFMTKAWMHADSGSARGVGGVGCVESNRVGAGCDQCLLRVDDDTDESNSGNTVKVQKRLRDDDDEWVEALDSSCCCEFQIDPG